MTQFAKETKVSVSSTKQAIEQLVERYGAEQFISGWSEERALIAFTMEGRQIRLILPMPNKAERRFTHHLRGERTRDASNSQWEQACRQRWRALLLIIKAKLEAVESGITVFEDEFMANIVLPNRRTVGEEVRPKIAQAYGGGQMQPLLPNYTEDATP